ncbi:MAG: cereblon family protein [Chloroflexota bacterium]
MFLIISHARNKQSIYALRSNDNGASFNGISPDTKSQADDQVKDTSPEFWHCVECHHPITRKDQKIEVNGQHRHVCMNPHGYVYQLGCFSTASGCLPASQPTEEFSWFPGYAWQICVCEQCHTLIGWAFRAPDARFWGLIINQLV